MRRHQGDPDHHQEREIVTEISDIVPSSVGELDMLNRLHPLFPALVRRTTTVGKRTAHREIMQMVRRSGLEKLSERTAARWVSGESIPGGRLPEIAGALYAGFS